MGQDQTKLRLRGAFLFYCQIRETNREELDSAKGGILITASMQMPLQEKLRKTD